MTTKLVCSSCDEVIQVERTQELCDTCRKKIDNGEMEGYDLRNIFIILVDVQMYDASKFYC